jgi:3-methylcrotonyl-CoA carboxylase beta subunit
MMRRASGSKSYGTPKSAPSFSMWSRNDAFMASTRTRAMGGEQAASVLATIRREAIEARGEVWPIEDEQAFMAPIRARYESEGNPYHATARSWDDGIIDPVQTRDILGLAYSVTLNAPISDQPRFGLFRM